MAASIWRVGEITGILSQPARTEMGATCKDYKSDVVTKRLADSPLFSLLLFAHVHMYESYKSYSYATYCT